MRHLHPNGPRTGFMRNRGVPDDTNRNTTPPAKAGDLVPRRAVVSILAGHERPALLASRCSTTAPIWLRSSLGANAQRCPTGALVADGVVLVAVAIPAGRERPALPWMNRADNTTYSLRPRCRDSTPATRQHQLRPGQHQLAHDPISSSWSISSPTALLRPPPHNSGSAFNALSTRSPSGAAPNGPSGTGSQARPATTCRRPRPPARPGATMSASAW